MIRILAILTGLAWLPLALALGSGPARPAQMLYQQGIAQFQSGHFQEAVEELRQAVRLAPGNARYHDALGRAYGRVAQRAGWIHAMLLAVKTRKEFEKAVHLDGTNVEALRDLMQFYRQAPGILGGSDRKADALQQRISELAGARTTASISQGSIAH